MSDIGKALMAVATILSMFLALAALMSLTGCATPASKRVDENEKAIVNAFGSVDQRFQAIEKGVGVMLEAIDTRIRALEAQLSGPWEKDECEYYTKEAQATFCKRRPRFIEVGSAPK